MLEQTNKIKLILLSILLVLLPISSNSCVDMYLPAYNVIANFFHVPESFLDISMATYLLGLSTGQLIYGSASDRFGRRRTLIVGLILFCFATTCCFFAKSFPVFLMSRFIQALGACSAVVLSRAIVADCFQAKARTQMLAIISASSIFSPALAPLVGGYLITHGSWRLIFFVLFLFGLTMLAGVLFLVRETLVDKNPAALEWATQKRNVQQLLHNRRFVGYVLSLGLTYATVLLWVTVSPAVLMGHFKIPALDFGRYFWVPAVGGCLGALVTAKINHYFNPLLYIRTGLGFVFCISMILMLFSNAVNAPLFDLLCMASLFFGTGLICPVLISQALGEFPAIRGFASGVIGCIQTGSAATVGFIANHFYGEAFHVFGFFLFILLSSAGGIFVWFTKNAADERVLGSA